MNKMNVLTEAAVAAALLMTAGCAFNPESMPIGQKDNTVYVDPGAPKFLTQKEARAKVVVVATPGNYKDYAQVAESLDSSLNEKLSNFAFFEMVDRKSAAALINEKAATADDPTAVDFKQVRASFMVIARIAMLEVSQGQTISRKGKVQPSGYNVKVQFDFKWLSVESQKVIMTKSITPNSVYAMDPAGVVPAVSQAAQDAVAEFCTAISTKYAPPARVLMTRGNGEAARISIGKNYGVAEGTQIGFFEIVDNSSVGGDKRDRNDIGRGTVKAVDEKSAWVRVHEFEKVNVRKGVYVRVLEEKQGGIGGLTEGLGVNGTLGL